MKVSVITVCFQAAATIRDTLESVSAQDYPDIEHIVVDGGSTDDTLAIVERFGARVATVLSEPDAGLYDGMNKGWRLATGEIVGYLHADDVYADPGAVSRIVAAAKASSADFILGDVDIVKREDVSRSVRYYSAAAFHPEWIEQGDMPPHPGVYHRRELFDRHGGYDLDYRMSADFDFFARMLYIHKASYAYCPGAVVKMRHGGQSSQGISSNIKMLKEVYRACRKHKIAVTPLSLSRKYVRKALQFGVFRRARHAFGR